MYIMSDVEVIRIQINNLNCYSRTKNVITHTFTLKFTLTYFY